jgi:hypothetical protein
MSKHCVLSLKPQLRLEWRGQDGQNETEQPDHSASLGDSITSSTRIRFSVHTRAYSLPPGPRRIASRICPDLISDRHRGARGDITQAIISTVRQVAAGLPPDQPNYLDDGLPGG